MFFTKEETIEIKTPIGTTFAVEPNGITRVSRRNLPIYEIATSDLLEFAPRLKGEREYIDVAESPLIVIYYPKSKSGKALGFISSINRQEKTVSYESSGEKFPKNMKSPELCNICKAKAEKDAYPIKSTILRRN